MIPALICAAAVWAGGSAGGSLDYAWEHPAPPARVRAYWWWLNGNVTRESLTRDLEEMKAKGFGGALICDAGGAQQDGNDQVPHGPTFFTPEWRELYKHALREADRLGLEMSLNIQSGWNLGGPMVPVEDAAKKITWSETTVVGPAAVERELPLPKHRDGYYRDWLTVAYRSRQPAAVPLKNWEQKAIHKTLTPFSAPDPAPLFQEHPAIPGEEDTASADVVELTGRVDANGVLKWAVPAGEWRVLRFGCTPGDHSRVSTSSDGWSGFALDVLDAGAFERYWDAVVEPLIRDAGPLAGRALKYLHTDSWEVESVNWTPSLRAEFKKRRGYDLARYAPCLAGRVVDSREKSNRFLHDFRKVIGELAIDHHYRIFRDRAHRRGLLIHPESGGPHAVPIDAQRCLGWNDAPMSEFWAWSWRHRVGDENRFFVKQPASAAHTYGRPLVLAEGFTTIGPHWQETLWDNLKPSFDRATCEGLNVLVWHAFVNSPREMGMPGQQYFAGTHLNPNVTWWAKSGPFFEYLNRCQSMMQRGHFVADVCYYYGDHVPNFARLKKSDPAGILPGYDYDVITEEALLTRARVRDGRLVLPDGMCYRVLAVGRPSAMSLPALRQIRKLARAGATVIGERPRHAASLEGFPACDREFARLAEELWGEGGAAGEHSVGKGRVVQGMGVRAWLHRQGVVPDFAAEGRPGLSLDFIHRAEDTVDIYFISSQSNRWEKAECVFRVSGRAPELWNPVTGERRFASGFEEGQATTRVPLEFPPYGSWAVVFRQPLAAGAGRGREPKGEPVGEIQGPWTVAFDPLWGGPAVVEFDRLIDWTQRPEPGVRHYSGTATYTKRFDLPRGVRPGNRRVWLDLGEVRELAEVRLNGKTLGIVWAPPFRVEATAALETSGNALEIEVVNFWPNRIIGDAGLPAGERRTRTNIRKLTKDTVLMPSGLLGPVRLLAEGSTQ